MTSREFRLRLSRRARKVGLVIPSDVAAGLESYFTLLSRWNQKVNLTALPLDGAPDETLDRLLVEPLLAARYVRSAEATLFDVGSGGGSPALPLKLSLPGLVLTMVEAKTRKSAFLREAVRHLGLTSVTVENARFEVLLSRPELHEAADVLTVRAVRVETKILTTLQAFLRPGGEIFLFRAADGPAAAAIHPPLELKGTHTLVDSLGSQLVVISKSQLPALR